MKYLIWAVVLYFAWRWYLASKDRAAEADRRGDADASAAGAADGATTTASTAATATGAVEKMVACTHCGIHLPSSEALTGADQRHYCCEEHRALHASS